MRTILPAIQRQLHDAVSALPGVVIENKGMALACHYRLASRADAAAASAMVAALVAKYQREHVGVAMLRGHEVVEIRPAAANKGTAVRALVAAVASKAVTVYIGDDQTDEEAFARLGVEAITVRVGPPTTATAAHYRADDPIDVHRLLRVLLASRTAPASRRPSGREGGDQHGRQQSR